ncbi:MAG: DUF1501 domain-containing protein [Lautropia sp.]|nr:DUF1501 domain-containing protein [Lautropia sp.]
MNHSHSHSRRHLLKSGLGLAVSGPAAFALNLANMNAAVAQTAGDYKALVCLFMHGGNDHANTVVATNGDSWKNYQAMRGGTIALAAPGSGGNALLPITPGNLASFGNSGLTLGLHPRLSKTQALFQARKLAIISNVGPLVEPTTAEQYRYMQTRVPRRLFSHNDQQSTWQTFSPEGNAAGWGGRMVERLASTHNASALFASAISAGGSPAAWLAGRQISPYSIPTEGAIGVQFLGDMGIGAREQALRAVLNAERSGNLLAQTFANLHRRTLDYQSTLQQGLIDENHSSLLAVPDLAESAGTKNPLAIQMRLMARVIASRNSIGIRRQIFFLNMPGFDTHDDQQYAHTRLMGQLDQALDYFDRQMTALGMQNQVTLFTASDFGRNMVSNGGGTDHGWGSHHFILGGAVDGGRLYGRFPTFGVDAGDDVGGRLVPQYSVEQYAAVLGRWFGLTQSELYDALPNLMNFPRDSGLGFMKA